MEKLRIDLLGDRALLVTLSQEISESLNDLVLSACEHIESAGIAGVEEAQPAYSSFCVHFDPSRVGAAWLAPFIRGLIDSLDSGKLGSHGSDRLGLGSSALARPDGGSGSGLSTGTDHHSGLSGNTVQDGPSGATALTCGATPLACSTAREVEIPVKYGGDDGPDLDWASEHLRLSPDEIVRRHAGGRYRVYMVGFAPGFPYLGGMDQSIALPRLPTPRTVVPAGSVAIGGGQTGVYPWESPGGWRIIGRTQTKLFSPGEKDPSLLHPGDVVRFVPVDAGASSGAVLGGGTVAGHRTVASDRALTGDVTTTAGEILIGVEAHKLGAAQVPENPSHPLAESSDEVVVHAGGNSVSVPALLVEHPGLLSLVVDAGRRGYRKLGVPVSGAADMNSFALANILCGNPPSAPALEMTLWGARLRALMDIVVAVTGAPSPLVLDGVSAPMNTPFLMREGSLLEVGSPPYGCRMYLAASGGFSVSFVMGSASTYLRGAFGGFEGRRLLSGDALRTGPGVGYEEIHKLLPVHSRDETRDQPPRLHRSGSCLLHQPGCSVHPNLANWPERLECFIREDIATLRVIPGPESASDEGRALLEALCGQTYSVRSDSDRMGIRFDGPVLEPGLGNGDILSSPVVPGVIQVPTDGMPVLLLCDAQTSGGYRRAATVASEDLPLAGQMRPGSRARFVRLAP